MKFKCIDDTKKRLWFQREEPKSITLGKTYFGQFCTFNNGPVHLLLFNDLGQWEEIYELYKFVPVDD